MNSISESLETLGRECKQLSIRSITAHTVVFSVNGRPQTFVWREGYVYRQIKDNSPRLPNETYRALMNFTEHLMRAAFAGYAKNQKKAKQERAHQMHLPFFSS